MQNKMRPLVWKDRFTLLGKCVQCTVRAEEGLQDVDYTNAISKETSGEIHSYQVRLETLLVTSVYVEPDELVWSNMEKDQVLQRDKQDPYHCFAVVTRAFGLSSISFQELFELYEIVNPDGTTQVIGVEDANC